MTDHREKHAHILGYFLIISSVSIFVINYFQVAQKLESWNQTDLVWNVLQDTIPVHIITVFLGLFAFSLRKGLEAGHKKANIIWLVLCFFLLGDSIYTVSVKFHIFVLIKSLFFLFLFGYALIKFLNRKLTHD